MDVKTTAKRIYSRIINAAATNYFTHSRPNEGWLLTMRKAIGMSAPQLARRLGVTRAAIYQAERKELAGEITIRQMEKISRAMGGKLVYAIIPDLPGNSDFASIEDIIRIRAQSKARAIVARANTHMSLENQALGDVQNQLEINRLAEQLIHETPPDFWDAP